MTETTDPKKCSSCGVPLAGRGVASFLCPACGKVSLGRCQRCRDQSIGYQCPECQFEGP